MFLIFYLIFENLCFCYSLIFCLNREAINEATCLYRESHYMKQIIRNAFSVLYIFKRYPRPMLLIFSCKHGSSYSGKPIKKTEELNDSDFFEYEPPTRTVHADNRLTGPVRFSRDTVWRMKRKLRLYNNVGLCVNRETDLDDVFDSASGSSVRLCEGETQRPGPSGMVHHLSRTGGVCVTANAATAMSSVQSH